MPLTRRAILLGALAAPLPARAFLHRAAFDGPTLAAPEALERVRAGTLTLVDIRRPDEWRRTGVPEGAWAIDMRRPDFAAAVLQAAGGDPSRPVALICARGVRSARVAALLDAEGFGAVLDVPEGMLGSAAGPGWLARGLPVRAAD
ncbi:rhodanese-like domain-containing protein [Jannaschia sp. W003]|uniref:rhodanese-like domain-containing protein n=1 Tax=Jannaschia sp. W003 TaxID=2867012 RepID=UPI0021A57390|nr:rhodanese-like domain-containing protein [Jannaschia sp. W003]UWQ20522.1 rhodanese-like domain-containing protein [Jannaschia sp. W003]